jgi:hypothetical protein
VQEDAPIAVPPLGLLTLQESVLPQVKFQQLLIVPRVSLQAPVLQRPEEVIYQRRLGGARIWLVGPAIGMDEGAEVRGLGGVIPKELNDDRSAVTPEALQDGAQTNRPVLAGGPSARGTPRQRAAGVDERDRFLNPAQRRREQGIAAGERP